MKPHTQNLAHSDNQEFGTMVSVHMIFVAPDEARSTVLELLTHPEGVEIVACLQFENSKASP